MKNKNPHRKARLRYEEVTGKFGETEPTAREHWWDLKKAWSELGEEVKKLGHEILGLFSPLGWAAMLLMAFATLLIIGINIALS